MTAGCLGTICHVSALAAESVAVLKDCPCNSLLDHTINCTWKGSRVRAWECWEESG